MTAGLVGIGVVAGLYAIGYLAAQPEAGLRMTLFQDDDATQIRNGLERLLAGIRYRVSDDIFQKVGSIAHSIVVTLPPKGVSLDAVDPNVNLLRQTALSYLPQALDAYLSIPRIYAERRPVDGTKTAHEVLMDQLNLMDEKLLEASEDIARNDTERLLANARFLQERFADSNLQVVAAQTAATSDSSDGPRIL